MGSDDGELLRSVVDCLDSRLCVVDGDGTVLATNRPWDDAWERERPGCVPPLGGDVFTLLEAVLPARASADLRECLRRVVDGADYQVVRGRRPRSSGAGSPSPGFDEDEEHFVVRIHPVRGHARARATLMYVDITDSVQASERLRRLTDRAHRDVAEMARELAADKALLSEVLDSIPHVVYWKDADLRYAGVNRAFLALRGLQVPADVLGRADADLGLADPLALAAAGIEAEVLAAAAPRLDVAVEQALDDGPPRQLMLAVLPRSRGAGVIGVAADVSQVRELERHLALAGRLESIGQLAAGIAHEINTPIQFVSDNLSFLAETFADLLPALEGAGPAHPELDLEFVAEEVPAALVQSQEGLGRVKEIVRAMRDFSHPRIDLAPSDLNRAVESTVQVSRNEWKYVADVELALDPEVGQVACFEGELKQVILNMIVNAAQALESSAVDRAGVKGHIRVHTARDGDTVEIGIADDGPGMTEEVRRRVFEPFFTTKDVGKGTGQGLSLAHRTVVGKHHGEVLVDSVPGHGARFTIRLPSPRTGDGDRPETR